MRRNQGKGVAGQRRNEDGNRFGTSRSERPAIQGGNVTLSEVRGGTNERNRLIMRKSYIYISKTKVYLPVLEWTKPTSPTVVRLRN